MSLGNIILRDIEEDLESHLNRCGIMHHIFSRTKSPLSIESKMRAKAEKYKNEHKKMQDLLALRITLYFTDDVEVVHSYLKKQENYIDEEVDKNKVDVFHPIRCNLILRVPDKREQDMNMFIKETKYSNLIDPTYEVQIRTILSEGWHEVEHDLRYKCKDTWNDYPEEDRLLNGIFATLENSEWSMLTLFNKLSYSQFKAKSWDSMLRNKMRIRFSNNGLSDQVLNFLQNKINVAKDLYKADRLDVLKGLLDSKFNYPLTYDTVVHIINRICIKNKELAALEDRVLKNDLDITFGSL